MSKGGIKMLRIAKFVTKEDYMNFAKNDEDRIWWYSRPYNSHHKTILDYLEFTIDGYANKYDGEEMRFALVENVLDDGTVKNSYISYGFIPKDREDNEDEFYLCC